MDVQYGTVTYPYLKMLAQGRQIREEVQQIKLPDSFPDIGRVVDCGGQVLVRGKEWRSDGIRVSGGVMVWVLYTPADGMELKCVEGWIPFQGKWEFRESKRDGTICVRTNIQNMDARSVSARKLMVRCSICLTAEALEPASSQIAQLENLPEGLQLLKNTYPLEVPLEAGEKLTQIEERMDLGGETVSRILFSRTEPVILENKILANRLIFRGKVNLHVLYSGEDGTIKAFDGEIPFSQYTDLDHEYTDGASAVIFPVPTVSEVELEGNSEISCKCSVAVQYIIYDRRNLTVIEDAYCPGRQVTLQRENISVPVRLDTVRQEFRLEERVEGTGKIVSNLLGMDCTEVMQVSDTAEIQIPVTYRMLVQDPDGAYRMQSFTAEEKWEVVSDADNRIRVCTGVSDTPKVVRSGDETIVSAAIEAEIHVLSQQDYAVVSSIHIGEPESMDPNRPSLILCRANGEDIWQIAKRYGSKVDALRIANGIIDEPELEQLLLIPIE